MSATAVSLGIVAAMAALFLILAWRHPILFKMAVRNGMRRKTQSLVVVLGLMVGTAIIAGSLVTGDTLEHGIKSGGYRALGPTDELVQIEGYLYFPDLVYDELASNATVQRTVHGLAPMILESGAIRNPAERLSEPRISVLGIDPAAERAFWPFTLDDGRTFDAATLGPRDVLLESELAAGINAKAGDTVTLSYSVLPTPVLPKITNATGYLVAASRADPGGASPVPSPIPLPGIPGTTPGGYVHHPANLNTTTFEVGRAGVWITAVVFHEPKTGADLDVEIVSPSGERTLSDGGSPAEPDNPVWTNVTSATGRLEQGEWRLNVHAKAAEGVGWEALILVFHEVYDLNEYRNFTREMEERGFEPERFGMDGLGTPRDTPVRRENLTVAGVLAPEGPGEMFLTRTAWLRIDTVQELYNKTGRINVVRVTNTGDVYDGLPRSAEVAGVLREAVADIQARHPDEPALERLRVVETKARWIANAEEAGEFFTTFLTTVSSFTIMAGIMLIVNIFVMLAEERKSESGMARAVGLTRRQLGLLFGFEGFMYALVAAAVGVLLGLGIAFLLILGFNEILSTNERNLVNFPFHFEWASLAVSFAAGLLITMATVAIASWRVSRLNVVRAIRRLDEPETRAGRALLILAGILLAAGASATYAGFRADLLPFKVLGPCLVVLATAMIATKWLKRRIVYPAAGGSVATYAGLSIFLFETPEGLANQLMGPVRGMILVIAAALVIVHLPFILRAAKVLLQRIKSLRAIAAPAVAYPLNKQTRTGLTIAMFALVILVIVAFTVFSATFNIDLREQTGGYHVQAETTVPISDLRAWYEQYGAKDVADPFELVKRHDDLVFATAFGGEFITVNGKRINYQGPPWDSIYAYNAPFAEHNAFELESRHPDYATDQEAYAAILDNPDLVIVSRVYTFKEDGSTGAFDVGATLSMNTTGGKANFTVIGIQKQIYMGGVWVGEDIVRTNFQRVRGQYLFEIVDDADPVVAAQRLEAAFEDAGMDAVSIEEDAQQMLEQNRQFLTLFQLFLGFGLVVGIASLGIITARSVLERRQEIGMLRAIGFPRSGIMKLFLVEILFTTTLGILIGTALGIFIAYGVANQTLGRFGISFVIPWLDIGLVILITYAVTLLCTWYPAWAASRILPAEAVRYIE